MVSGWRDAADGLLHRKPFAGSWGRAVRVVGLGLCPEGTGSLKIYTVSKILAKYVVVLSLGLLVPEEPLGRDFRLQGRRLWFSLEKPQMRAFRPWIVR